MTDLFRSRDKLLPFIPRQNYFWLKHATSRWNFLTGSNVKNIHPQSFSSPGNDNSIRITLEYDTCGVQRNPNSRHERVPRYHWLDVVFFPIADTNVWDPEGKMLAVLAEPLLPFFEISSFKIIGLVISTAGTIPHRSRIWFVISFGRSSQSAIWTFDKFDRVLHL